MNVPISPVFMSGFGYGYLRNGANDPTGQIRQWTQNHSGLAGPRTLALGYDEVDQLTDATRTETGGAVSGKWSYGYDKSGNRLAALENGVVSQFVANDFNQLTGTVAAQKFPVKFAGTTNEPSDVTVGGLNAGTNTQNWSAEVPLGAGANSVEIRATETTSIAPGTVAQTTVRRAQLTLSVSPARVFGYDLNGSTTADGLRTYEWDAANRLRAIVTAGTPVKRTEFTYDGSNRWVFIEEQEAGLRVSSRRVIWEGARIAQVRLYGITGTETERRTFYSGGEVRKVGTTTTALLETSDHLGNVRELLDSTGTVRARYDYDVYGKRTKISGDLNSDFGFTGHYEHAPSTLTLAPFRAYDAVMGRWISRDPIEESGGLNLYGYVGGNVAGAVDPLGLASDKIGGLKLQVHKNDVDPWPSTPHAHSYPTHQVVDTAGNIYDTKTKKFVAHIGKKNMARLTALFTKATKVIPLYLFLQDASAHGCEAAAKTLVSQCLFLDEIKEIRDAIRGDKLDSLDDDNDGIFDRSDPDHRLYWDDVAFERSRLGTRSK